MVGPATSATRGIPGGRTLSDSSIERRAHPRHDRSVEIEGVVHHGTVARMRASNLSLGGLYCTSTIDFPEMTRLAVRLMLPTGTPTNAGLAPLDVEAVVVRRREIPRGAATTDERFELALFFPRLDDEQKRELARFLRDVV